MLVDDIRSSLQSISGSKLQYALDMLKTSADPNKCAEVVAMLNTVREELLKVQIRTEDCMSVLEHYHTLSTQGSESPPEDQ